MSQIVGREDELHQLGRFFDRAAETFGALILEGEPGIGKSTVWRRALAQAEDRGISVLACQPAAAEAKLSYASVADLLGPVSDDVLAELPAPQARALAVALLRAEPADGPPDQRAIGTALATLLGLLGDKSPVLVAVDDVQWLDRPSAAALAFAMRRLGDRRVGILLAHRIESESQDVPLGLDRLPSGAVTRLRLSGLSAAGLYHVIRDELGEALARPALMRIEAASGGNPLYALELARASLAASVGVGEPLPVPDTLSGLVEERVAELPPEAFGVVLAAASLSVPTVDLIERAAGEGARDALSAAERGGLVRLAGDAVRFVHPLFASAVYSRASAETRREWHRRLAEAVEDPEERARHLARGADGPDEAVAAALEAAAERARARGAPGSAAELAELSVLLTPEEVREAVRRRSMAAAEGHFLAGDRARARELAEGVVREAEAGAERGNALAFLGKLSYSEDSFPEAIRLLEEALLSVDDPALAVPIRHALTFAYVSTGDPQAAITHGGLAVEEAERHGDAGLLAEALGVSTIVRFMAGAGPDLAELDRALALEDETRTSTQLFLRPRAVAGMIAVYDARLSEGCERLRVLRDWAFERGEESELPILLDHLAWGEWWRGEYTAAARVVEETIAICEQSGNEAMRSAALVHRSKVRALTGQVDEARADAAEAYALFERSGWTFGIGWALTAAGQLELAAGEPAAAVEVFAPLVDMSLSAGMPDPAFVFYVPDAVEALVSVDDLERAEQLLDTFERQARRLGRGWAVAEAMRARSVLLGEQGDLDAALAAAHDANDRYDALELPLERGRALLQLGRLHRRRREKLLAREALERALTVFEELGAVPWVDQARQELARVGLRRADPYELTETERRVAELAAEGKTNREVARLLFMSPKTVEANLSRVYRKLEIASRAELGARMEREREAAATQT